MIKPSNYCFFPLGSFFNKAEAETVALNIMTILKRNGDKWRRLSWKEYKSERIEDGKLKSSDTFCEMEKIYFDRVIPYTTSANIANKVWRAPKIKECEASTVTNN